MESAEQLALSKWLRPEWTKVGVQINYEDLGRFMEIRRAVESLLEPLCGSSVARFYMCDQVRGSVCTNYKQAKHYEAEAIIQIGAVFCECGSVNKVPTFHLVLPRLPLASVETPQLYTLASRYAKATGFFEKHNRIGIMFGETVSASQRRVIELLRRLLRTQLDKTVLLLSCHPLTNEKLENFEDIEAFVFVGCAATTRAQVLNCQKEFRRPVITPVEVLWSLGVLEFDGELLPECWTSALETCLTQFVAARCAAKPAFELAVDSDELACLEWRTGRLAVLGSGASLINYKDRSFKGVGGEPPLEGLDQALYQGYKGTASAYGHEKNVHSVFGG